MADHDHPYKILFSRQDLVADLISGFVPGLADEVDLASLTRRNGSFVTADWREREDDIIWSVRWRGRDLYIYLLIEFQSAVDEDMALRLTGYTSLLWQDLRRTGAAPAGTPLPPILPLVLYNGEPAWTAATDLHDLVADYPAALARFRPRLPYLLIDETRMALSQHDPVRNLAAAVFALEQDSSPQTLFALGERIRDWLHASGRGEIAAEMSSWWIRTIAPDRAPLLPNPFERTPMLLNKILRWQDEFRADGEAKGEARGEAKGKAEGKIQVILDLAVSGDLSVARAETRLRHLAEQREISSDQLAQALRSLQG